MSKLNIFDSIRLHARNVGSLALSVCVETLVLYNCRVSEVLGCDSKKIFPNQYVILKGVKGSDDIVIRDRQLVAQYVKLSSATNGAMFKNLTYQSVYSFLKKNYGHLFESLQNGKNKKVTHAFRYINIFPLTDDDTIKTVLHHKSKRSNKYYKRKKSEVSNGNSK